MKLTFDFRDFERAARGIDALASQIPFALAQSLNQAAEVARQRLIDTTWAQHVTVRNPNFLKAALTTRGERATKRRLSATIFDQLDRAGLQQHAKGGTKHPRGANLAIPESKHGNVAPRRTGKGIPKGLRPAAIPNSFKRGDAIYQRTGKYQKAGKVRKNGTRRAAADTRGLKLMYVLKPSTPVRADVPFYGDFEQTMRREVPAAFSRNIRAAMKTAFRR